MCVVFVVGQYLVFVTNLPTYLPELASVPLSLWQLQMWMSALWIGPVTTAASTTLAHSLVIATKGTPSMASPTVEVSGCPSQVRLGLVGAGPSPEVYCPNWGERYISVQWQQVHWLKRSMCWRESAPFVPWTHQVCNGAERGTELFQLWILGSLYWLAILYREWEALARAETLSARLSQKTSERLGRALFNPQPLAEHPQIHSAVLGPWLQSLS